MGFTAFQPCLFGTIRLCGTLRLLWPLTSNSPPSPFLAPKLMVSFSTITTDITVCASMDFPNAKGARLSDGLTTLLYNKFLFYGIKNRFSRQIDAALVIDADDFHGDDVAEFDNVFDLGDTLFG